MNRFFKSVELAEYLLQNNTYINVGTIMTKSRGLPPDIRRKLKTRGELIKKQRNNLAATLSFDKRTVTLISSKQLMRTELLMDVHTHSFTTAASWEMWVSWLSSNPILPYQKA
ncbi:PiggyBac transposable element-derived protein 4-like [Plakobranchus ocellatus]|uniref:PiggyBac transposable element-derived protein 4-like n=1 Tax=Plakobranchus ocellatus TaxID=259542 RepID=A0AAV4DDJ2_9GAST|nr:PiggyBac transposable element-derived protein 4-like [Plakobranchus ocellatus]